MSSFIDPAVADQRFLLRNNVPDVAQILKDKLVPQEFVTNIAYALTTHKKFQQGVQYYTRTVSRPARTEANTVYRYIPAQVTVGEAIPENTYYVRKTYTKANRGGYPQYTIPRGVGDYTTDTAFDSRWDDGIGMYKLPDDSVFQHINGLNAFALPRVLKAVADFCAKYRWRLRLLIDACLATLIDKFVITEDPASNLVEANGVHTRYFQTADEFFQEGKEYYIKAGVGFVRYYPEVGDRVRTASIQEKVIEQNWRANESYYVRVIDDPRLGTYKFVALVEGADYTPGGLITGTTNVHVTPHRPFILDEVYIIRHKGFNDYYEKEIITFPDYVMRIKEADSTTPMPNRYYTPVAAGAVIADDSEKIYFYDEESTDYLSCSLVPVTVGGKTLEYYTLERNETTGGLEYVKINFDNPSNCTPDAFAGKSVYRKDDEGEYICIGNGIGCALMFLGKTKNNSWSKHSDSKLYKQVEIGSSTAINIDGTTKHLYVDPKDEDIERVKDVINAFMLRYRTVLVATGRNNYSFQPVRDGVRYTVADLRDRLNIVVDIINSCSPSTSQLVRMDYVDATGTVMDPTQTYSYRNRTGAFVDVSSNSLIATDDSGAILPAAEQVKLGKVQIYLPTPRYTVRDMKLKANEIIDWIRGEKFYLKFVDSAVDFNLNKLDKEFWEMLGGFRVLYQMATVSNFDSTNDSYNDRWFFYDPAIPYIADVFNVMNLTCLKGKDDEDVVTGDITRDEVDIESTPKNFGEYYIYAGVFKWVPLKYVANVYATANEWSSIDYSGCMQIIDLTGQLLVTRTPDGVSWEKAITDPRVDIDPEVHAGLRAILKQILHFKERLDLLTKYSPHVADVVVDIAYHVGSVFQMNMDVSIPRMVVPSEFVADTSYYFFSGETNTFVSTGTVHTQSEYDALLKEHGTLYLAVVHD